MALTLSMLIGKTQGNTSNRRYTFAPNNLSSDFSVQEDRLTTIVERSKKRKAPTLTRDNASSVFSTSFDIKASSGV
jgi:hypothetical protein